MPVKKKAQSVVVEESKVTADLTREQLVQMLRQMLAIRRLEERAAQAYGQGKIGGFCHLYIGQEAVAVGALAALRPEDHVLTTYRDHGLALARGMSAVAVFAELFGREAGCSRGRGGSMHMFDKEKNFHGGHGIVGGHIPLGTGMAFASKYLKEDRVTVCFFGEGAVNNGNFHEALNLAALWQLPVVYICENNKYGMGTAVERVSALVELHRKAEAYAMRHARVDGMDALEVYRGMKDAVQEAREGRPSFLEIVTYRFRGHSMSDPVHSVYRTKEEVECQREKDPITRLAFLLQQEGILGADDVKALDKEVSTEIKRAMEAALESPEPDLSAVYDYVYVNDPRGIGGPGASGESNVGKSAGGSPSD